jgi:hypothetical protein
VNTCKFFNYYYHRHFLQISFKIEASHLSKKRISADGSRTWIENYSFKEDLSNLAADLGVDKIRTLLEEVTACNSMTAACRLGANWRHYHMTTVRCWFQSPQSIHCWKHYNSLFVCYWLFPPTFSFLKHLPFMNAASWAWNQFLMDAWDGFAITGSFFSKNFASTHTRCTLTKITWNGFHILIMRRNDMTLTHLSLLSLRWDWYWFQAWSAHDTRKMNNTVPLLNCCKLWVQWSGHLFKESIYA